MGAWESPHTAEHANDSTHPSSSYWDWSTPQEEKQQQSSFVCALLEYEKARLMLSVDHHQELLENCKARVVGESLTKSSSDDYWMESSEISTPAVNYWDWSSQPLAAKPV